MNITLCISVERKESVSLFEFQIKPEQSETLSRNKPNNASFMRLLAGIKGTRCL